MRCTFSGVLIILSFFCSTVTFTQKPALTLEVLQNGWPRIEYAAITNDGRYVMYTSTDEVNRVITEIADVKRLWRRKIERIRQGFFTCDNRKFIYQKDDSLIILQLGTEKSSTITGIVSWRLVGFKRQPFIIYKSRFQNELILCNLVTNTSKSFGSVENFYASSDGNGIVLQRNSEQNTSSLFWTSAEGEKPRLCWQGPAVRSIKFDDEGVQIVFLSNNGLWYYKKGQHVAHPLLANLTIDNRPGEVIESIDRFSRDRQRVFLKIARADSMSTCATGIKVDVWSYQDILLQSRQLQDLSQGDGDYDRKTVAIVSIQDKKIIFLQNREEEFRISSLYDTYGFVTCQKGIGNEYAWNARALPQVSLVSTKTGQRWPVANQVSDPFLFSSPYGDFILLRTGLWGTGDLMCYETRKGKIRNITAGTRSSRYDEESDGVVKDPNFEVAAWIDDGKSVLIYDRYDIWLADLEGRNPIVNVTNGEGRKNRIIYRLVGNLKFRKSLVQKNKPLLLSAFNEVNKQNGFFLKSRLNQKKLVKLCMSSQVYYHSTVDGLQRFEPIKAKEASVWVVSRESASEAPNLFLTSDFKTFNPVTDLRPEKKYNWLSSQLVIFHTLDGLTANGILYKPENFDSTKKYPLIIHYYEKLSQRLNVYKTPELSSDNINVPWFVSRGYIVFEPDIIFNTGEHAKSTVNYVLGAAYHLMKFSWIDSEHVGLNGHSMGGFETNNVLTNTNIFAAACTAAGTSDLISHAGQLSHGEIGGHDEVQFGQYRMGATLWDRPDLYIENSPLFKLHKVTTPVLIMHNKQDGAVPFAQGIELFTALRRLGKRSWLLQYDNQGHNLNGDSVCKDFTIRISQFFDHYLKGALAPKWMTRGIPAKMKGIDDGLELDYEIKTPPEGGLLTEQEKKKVEALQHREPITVTFE